MSNDLVVKGKFYTSQLIFFEIREQVKLHSTCFQTNLTPTGCFQLQIDLAGTVFKYKTAVSSTSCFIKLVPVHNENIVSLLTSVFVSR